MPMKNLISTLLLTVIASLAALIMISQRKGFGPIPREVGRAVKAEDAPSNCGFAGAETQAMQKRLGPALVAAVPSIISEGPYNRNKWHIEVSDPPDVENARGAFCGESEMVARLYKLGCRALVVDLMEKREQPRFRYIRKQSFTFPITPEGQCQE
jgi:hypothetical protein